VDAKRKSLEKKGEQNLALVRIPIPSFAEEELQTVLSMVADFPGKQKFGALVLPYWKLKRHFKNGLPLIQRLQLLLFSSKKTNSSNIVNSTLVAPSSNSCAVVSAKTEPDSKNSSKQIPAAHSQVCFYYPSHKSLSRL